MKLKYFAIVLLIVIFTPIILMSISMSLGSACVTPENPKLEIIIDKKEKPMVYESEKKEEYMVEAYDNTFTSDVRDINNENYNSYVFGGKLSK